MTGVRGRRGKFEHADTGTLFLDEVSDLSPAAQAKLLRVIQELTVERVGSHATRRVDTRIVVATNRGLRELVTKGLFREDLYYRLSGVELHVPPLRARRDDVLELADHFLGRYSAARPFVLSPVVRETLKAYDWPGNVRQLERLIEGVVALAGSERIQSRAPAAAAAWRECRHPLPVAIAGRHDARLGQSLRAARARALRPEQAARLSGPGPQLSHAAGLPAVSRDAGRAGGIGRLCPTP